MEIIEKELKDPITYDIMKEPVSLYPCMHTFDKEPILKWLTDHNTCPLCGVNINKNNIKSNILIHNIISNLYPDIIVDKKTTNSYINNHDTPNEHLLDPISKELMNDPVKIIPCEHNFDRKIIEDWNKRSNKCPICNKNICNIVTNFIVRKKIEVTYPNFKLRYIDESNYDMIFNKLKNNEYINVYQHDIDILKNLPIEIKNSTDRNPLVTYIKNSTRIIPEMVTALMTPDVIHYCNVILNHYCLRNGNLNIEVVKLLKTTESLNNYIYFHTYITDIGRDVFTKPITTYIITHANNINNDIIIELAKDMDLTKGVIKANKVFNTIFYVLDEFNIESVDLRIKISELLCECEKRNKIKELNELNEQNKKSSKCLIM